MLDYVYIIEGTNNNKTKYYIGYTNNPAKRIRQHNNEIKGGAKATKNFKWKFVGLISNIGDNIEGLQIEWRLKHSTKKYGIINRIDSFLEYVESTNCVSSKSNNLDHKLFMLLDNKLYEKINNKIWKNIIIEGTIIDNNDIKIMSEIN